MPFEPSTELRAHLCNVLANAFPTTGSITERVHTDEAAAASLTASVHSLNVHLDYRFSLKLDIDQFLPFLEYAQTVGENTSHTWDGDDYAWDQGIDVLAHKLESLFASDGRIRQWQRGGASSAAFGDVLSVQR